MVMHLEYSFVLVITNFSSSPNEWLVSLTDYDGSVGAEGHFTSEQEAVDSIEGFLALAIPAYEKKYAKYNQMPIITKENGILKMTISDPNNDDLYYWDER